MKEITLSITKMTCASCATILNRAFQNEKRILKSSVNIANHQAKITFDPQKISEKEITKIIIKAGYGVAQNQEKEEKAHLQKMKKTFILSAIFSLPIFYVAMGPMIGIPTFNITIFANLSLQFIFTTIIILINWHIYTSGTRKLLNKTPNMDSLIVIGTLSAYFYSTAIFLQTFLSKTMEMHHVYFESAAFILVFIALGKFLEEKTKGKTSNAIKKLIGLQPKTATILKDKKEITIAISSLKKGDIVIVKAGEKIPVDGKVIFGASTIDESSITGESMPISKGKGSIVIGGTINKTGILHFTAEKVGEDTMLAQIIKIMEEAISSKAPVQLLVDKVSYYFVPTVIFIAILSFIVWYFLGFGVAFALTAFVSVLVIACPCTLGLATPTAVMMGTGLAAQRGILIKNAKALESARKIDTIIFDKTGTITKGTPEVVDLKAFEVTEEEILKLAFSLAKNSHHPLSLAVKEYAIKKNISSTALENFEEKEGKGLKAHTKSSNYLILLGNKKILADENIPLDQEAKQTSLQFAQKGKTPLFIARNNQIIGIIGVMDDVKEDSKKAIAQLEKMGKKVIMITGDHQKVAEAIAEKVGIKEVIAEVYPAQKAEKIKQLQSEGSIIAMVGDGINDAPALAQSDLGIALGSGTDIAIEAGEIILIRNNLLGVVQAINISAYTLRKIKQNLFWAFFYNTAGIPLASGLFYPIFGFLLNPMIAALAMSFSSVSVVTNSLIMKFYKAPTLKS